MITSMLLVFLVLTFIFRYWYSRRRLCYLAEKIPGPPAIPFLGNSLFLLATPRGLLKKVGKMLYSWPRLFRFWVGPFLIVAISDPEDVEVILRSTKLIEKGWTYKFLKPWLGNGLITSDGTVWHVHRKVITPTFHFKILEQFVTIFDSNCNILVSKLKEKVDGEAFDVTEYLELYSLDTICETSMGFKPNGQLNKHNPYVEAVKKLGDISQKRIMQPWLHSDFIFNLTQAGREFKAALKTVHDISKEIVKRKREELKVKIPLNNNTDSSDTGEKKKMAFLDHVLLSSATNEALTDEDIQNEVDTFMFAGHDTTTSIICFTLFLLGHHPEIQEKAYKEVKEILGDTDRSITFRDLAQMKYVERCLLESLRVYPIVPLLGRKCKEEIKIGEHLIPEGCMILIFVMKMHYNPKYFPKPSVFDPDRFLPENVAGRHPYCFIPFSAGPRNCLGQKYAMIQAKCILASILRNFKVTSACERNDLIPVPRIVTKTANGVPIKLTARYQQRSS